MELFPFCGKKRALFRFLPAERYQPILINSMRSDAWRRNGVGIKMEQSEGTGRKAGGKSELGRTPRFHFALILRERVSFTEQDLILRVGGFNVCLNGVCLFFLYGGDSLIRFNLEYRLYRRCSTRFYFSIYPPTFPFFHTFVCTFPDKEHLCRWYWHFLDNKQLRPTIN